MNKKLLCMILVFVVVLSALFPTASFASGKETPVSAAKTAVVRLMMQDSEGTVYSGSAFGVGKTGKAPEYFVTNAHNCLDDDGKPMKAIYILLDSSAVTITTIPVVDDELYIIGNLDDINFDYSKMVKCSVVNKDSLSLFPDVAVIKADKPIEGRSVLKLIKTAEDLKETQEVYALGFPADLDDIQAGEFSKKMVATPEDVNFNAGSVAQKMKNVEGFGSTSIISHTAQIAHGNSGGPLLDENGAVVGINTYRLDKSNAGMDGNYYFSIYVDYARDILDSNDITYETSGKFQLNTKSIVLIAAMIVIAAVAVIMIMNFNKKKNSFLDNKEKEEAQALRLQGVAGVFAGRRFPIDNQVTIGRAPSNNIVFPTTTKGVSGNHCVVINTNGQIYVKDVSSQGTFLNGSTKLPANQLVSVKVGDRISLGSENETFMITRKGGKV